MQSWYNQTTLHPLGLAAVIVLGALMLLLPRRYALVPMLIMACFISPAQRFVIATLDFNLLRVMVLFGWARILLLHETRGYTWKRMDAAIILWTIVGTVAMTLLEGTVAAFIYRLGFMFDAIGMYFLFRILIRGWEDLRTIAVSVAAISLAVAPAFLHEQMTARNFFAIFGGVPEITMPRQGRLRCQGPFPHPILAGCFWTSLAPLIGALWWHQKYRWLAPAGLLAVLAIVYTNASATPLAAVAMGIPAAACYLLRRHMRLLRWVGVAGLVVIQIVMVNPIWHLLARVSLVSGDTGWYRYKLFDEFVHHIPNWWLLGTTDYESWWEYGFYAITNQYVLEGVSGGLLTLVLFIAIIVFGFSGVGRILTRFQQPPRSILAWALGVGLVLHCGAFFAVSYFGQIIMIWFMLLAAITSLIPTAQRRLRISWKTRETPAAARRPLRLVPAISPAATEVPM